MASSSIRRSASTSKKRAQPEPGEDDEQEQEDSPSSSKQPRYELRARKTATTSTSTPVTMPRTKTTTRPKKAALDHPDDPSAAVPSTFTQPEPAYRRRRAERAIAPLRREDEDVDRSGDESHSDDD